MPSEERNQTRPTPVDVLGDVLQSARLEAQRNTIEHLKRSADVNLFGRHFYVAYVDSYMLDDVLDDEHATAQRFHKDINNVKRVLPNVLDLVKHRNIYVGDKHMHDVVFDLIKKKPSKGVESVTHVLCLTDKCLLNEETAATLTAENIIDGCVSAHGKVCVMLLTCLCWVDVLAYAL